jgi:hypothetical protein
VSEAAFPLLGAAFVVLVVLPCCAALARIAIALIERGAGAGPLHWLNVRYVLITASTFLPLAWFCSAGLHQLESGGTAIACLINHDGAALCFEPGIFALVLVLVVLARSVPVLREARGFAPAGGPAARALSNRIDQILEHQPELSELRGRIVATEGEGCAVATQGWLRPRVAIGVAFAGGLTDEMLAGALGHELEHVRLLDPLRFRVLALALAVNPVGRLLLQRHVSSWLAAREAHCDRQAVLHGAKPLPLAEAIIYAARPATPRAVALGARDTASLRLRVAMLLAFSETPPRRCCRHEPSSFPLAVVLLLLALLLPHRAGTGALDALHTGAEQTLGVLLP